MTVTATAKPPKRPCGCAKKRQAMTEAQRLAAAIRDARMVGRAGAEVVGKESRPSGTGHNRNTGRH
jgi:hypothetical protein